MNRTIALRQRGILASRIAPSSGPETSPALGGLT